MAEQPEDASESAGLPQDFESSRAESVPTPAPAKPAQPRDKDPRKALEDIGIGSPTVPKHAGEGTFRLVRSIICGAASGVTAFIAAPVVGAQKEGVKGFCKGLGAGTVGLISLPIAGIGFGLDEFGKGACKSLTWRLRAPSRPH
jgi:hypothetical protein